MKNCPLCGEPIPGRWIFRRDVCKACEDKESQMAVAEAARVWDFEQVGEEDERDWRPEACPFCDGSMLTGFVWNSDTGDFFKKNNLNWVAGDDPPLYGRSDFTILRNSDDGFAGWRRAHLCQSCGSLLVIQALRNSPGDNT